MNLNFLPAAVTSKVARQLLVAQKHSPVLMFGTGAVGVVATVVLACRATLKVDDVLKQGEHDKAKIEAASDLPDEKYNEADKQQDLKLSRVKIAIGVAKLYAPAVVIGVASLALLTGSHVILTKRNAGLTAAYAALDKMFNSYRARVVADVGPEKDQEYRYDLVDKEIAVEDETGSYTKTVKVPGPDGRSQYAVCFEKGSSHNWKPEHMYNQMFLSAQQTWANNKLRADGHLFLNDVYRMLGFPDTPAGAVTGWIDGGDGDSTVDFGVFRYDTDMGNMFVNGNERAVWIDPNVDGIIYDKI